MKALSLPIIVMSVLYYSFASYPTVLPDNSKAEANQSELMVIEINHYKVPCMTMTRQMCYLVRNEGDSIWNYFPNSITGFNDYKWGFIYKLKVLKEQVSNPPSDAPAINYRLVSVLSKEQIDKTMTFRILLKYTNSEPFTLWDEENGLTILNEIPFICENTQTCEELVKLNTSNASIEGTFRHSDNYKKLILISLKIK